MIFYVWFKLEHYVCTTPAKPSLPRVIQKSLTINNLDGGMRNVFMCWKNKFPRLFAKILPYLRVFDMLLLTYFNYIPTMQFCECRFSYHIFVKFQKRKLTSSQASNSDFFSFFCFNKYRGQQVNSSKGYKWILLYKLICLFHELKQKITNFS